MTEDAVKVLFYLQSMVVGGAQRVVATLANHWAEKGWDVLIVTLTEISSDFYSLDPRVRRVKLKTGRSAPALGAGIVANLCRARWLRTLLRAERPNVAIAMMETANIVLALAGAGLPVVLIGSERIYPPRSEVPWHWHKARNWGYRGLRAIVAQTTETAAWLRKHTTARDVRVIANPILLPLDRHEPVVRAPAADGGRLLLAVGRLVPQKRFDALLEAFSRAARSAPKWRLALVGDGPQRKALERQASALGLTERVLFVGKVGNAGDWYAAAHLYALSSEFEGYPNTLLEALAHGVPAVSFDCSSGPRDLIREGIDGLLVPASDIDAFADALLRLMQDDRKREEFAARAREAVQRFALPHIAAEWEALFAELTGSGA